MIKRQIPTKADNDIKQDNFGCFFLENSFMASCIQKFFFLSVQYAQINGKILNKDSKYLGVESGH